LALRDAQRLAILGAPIETRTAELSSSELAGRVLYHRTMRLFGARGPLPDDVLPDVPKQEGQALTDEQEKLRLASAVTALFSEDGELPAPLEGSASRSALEPLPNEPVGSGSLLGLPWRVTALVVAHGAAHQFFPYRSVIDDDFDQRLEDTVALTRNDEDSAASLERALGRLAHGLQDSRTFVFHFNAQYPGRLALHLEQSNAGEPVVRLSGEPDFAPGDTLVALDGIPVAEVMAQRGETISSGASSRFRNEANALLARMHPTVFTVRDAAGNVRSVTVDPEQGHLLPAFPARPHGFLTDLGAPTDFYVDAYSFTSQDLIEAESSIAAATRLILDLRGSPDGGSPRAGAILLVTSLLTDGSSGLRRNLRTSSVLESQVNALPDPWWEPNPNGFNGPVVVLVSPYTQFTAERLVLTLQAAGRATVVGSPTAGAVGDVSSVVLPGRFTMLFPSLEILQPDGSTFHGVGVLPDLVVPLSAAALANGADPELEMALAFLAL
jgi:hypothetical protein